MSVAAFAEYFNLRFLRPRELNPEVLRQAAAGMAMGRLDLIAARALELDRGAAVGGRLVEFRNYTVVEMRIIRATGIGTREIFCSGEN